jgi:RNA recognition motif-containing protein
MSTAVKEVAVGTKLYVGSLPYSTTEQQLSELFAQHGTVQSAKVITDRYTGQSRGFGFVEMATSEEAQKAIAALNGSNLGGRTLVVNEARPQEKRSFGGGGGGGGDQRDRW